MMIYCTKVQGFLRGGTKIQMALLKIYKISALLLLAYLLGSIPWGLILSRIFSSIDIRAKGKRKYRHGQRIPVAVNCPGYSHACRRFLKKALFRFTIAGFITGGDSFLGSVQYFVLWPFAFWGHLFLVFS
jgi:hypothetical protein